MSRLRTTCGSIRLVPATVTSPITARRPGAASKVTAAASVSRLLSKLVNTRADG